MEKFVKDKLKTAKMQPLPQTWDKIEAVLDNDKKAWYQRRLLLGLLFVLLGAGATYYILPSETKVQDTLVVDNQSEASQKKLPIITKQTEIEQEVNEIATIEFQEEKKTNINRLKQNKTLRYVKGFEGNDERYNQEENPNNGIYIGASDMKIRKVLSAIGDLSSLKLTGIPYEISDELHPRILGPSLSQKNNKVFGHNFSLEQSIGVSRSFYTNELSDFEYLQDKPGYGVDIQMLGGMNLGKNITLNAGIRYVKYAWKSSVGQSRKADTLGGASGYVIAPSSSFEFGNYVETKSYLKYFSVPTTLNYTIVDRRLKLAVGIGLSADWLVGANVIEYYPDYETYVGISSDTREVKVNNFTATTSSNNVDLLNKFSLSYHVQTPVQYGLTDHLNLVATPFGTIQGANFIDSRYSSRKAYSYGLRLGLKLDL
jgi:hypothetical protein